jgi:DNA invertase Pin-like site-specific DNA recombinase
MPKRRKVIAYLRVSTPGQASDGCGLDLQMSAIEEYARHEKLDIVATYRDVQTGVGTRLYEKRPGLCDALERAFALKAPILVSGLDRISRNTSVLETLINDRALPIISARAGEKAGKAVILTEMTSAQAVRERISTTTKDALRKLKAQGTPLGNRKNLSEAAIKGAEANSEKADKLVQQLAPEVMKLREKGHATKAAIAKGLNDMGFRTPRGKKWTASTIRRPLDRIDARALARTKTSSSYSDNPDWGTF